MKAVVLEIKDGVAAALREDGVVVRTSAACRVGETIELDAAERTKARGRTRRARWLRTAVAAVLALTLTGGTYYTTSVAAAYVSLDTEETSVEFSVNRLGQVIGVQAMNEESQALAETLRGDVRRKPVEDALNAAMHRLYDEGFLHEGAEKETVVAGVTAGNSARCARLSEAVERSVGCEGGRGAALYLEEVTPLERREARARELSGGRYLFEQRQGGFPGAGGPPPGALPPGAPPPEAPPRPA